MAMDESTQLNHWIALMAELEETREKIAKAVYKHYQAGRIADEYCLECCRRVDALYQDAQEYESHMQDEFRPFTEAKAEKEAGGGVKLATAASKKAAGFIAKLYIRHNVAAFKRHFRDQYLDLGARVVSAAEEGRVVCNVAQVLELCRYASKLKKEADMRWEEIEILHREKKSGSAFLTTVRQFFTSFTSFARTNGPPFLRKLMGQNEELVKQLRSQYRQKIMAADKKA